jgi:hypothetical protein
MYEYAYAFFSRPPATTGSKHAENAVKAKTF